MPMQSEQNSNPKPEEEYSFLTETIKPKSISRKKLFVQLIRMAIYGVIIGIFACCGFFALKPWAERTFGEESEEVTIPKDTVELPKGEAVETEKEPLILDEQSYRQMMDKLYLTAQEAKKCLVTVRVKSDEDWTKELEKTNSSAVSSAGIIMAENSRELLVVADNSVCEKASEWEILFTDGKSLTGTLKVQDKNRGLAVFSIDEEEIPETTANRIQPAELGNSNLVIQGDVVIGLGNLFGYEEGLGYGVVSSVAYEEVFSDGQCGIIATDIAVAQSGTGILINQKGQIIGLIRQGLLRHGETEGPEVTANALAISDLKAVMELMLNGKSVPYAGIHGVTVTAEVAEEQRIPEGLYVTQIEGDSPAMAAGIQNGDVIQSVNGEEVTGITSFERAVLKCTSGESVKVQGMRRGSDEYVEAAFSLNVGSKE